MLQNINIKVTTNKLFAIPVNIFNNRHDVITERRYILTWGSVHTSIDAFFCFSKLISTVTHSNMLPIAIEFVVISLQS